MQRRASRVRTSKIRGPVHRTAMPVRSGLPPGRSSSAPMRHDAGKNPSRRKFESHRASRADSGRLLIGRVGPVDRTMLVVRGGLVGIRSTIARVSPSDVALVRLLDCTTGPIGVACLFWVACCHVSGIEFIPTPACEWRRGPRGPGAVTIGPEEKRGSQAHGCTSSCVPFRWHRGVPGVLHHRDGRCRPPRRCYAEGVDTESHPPFRMAAPDQPSIADGAWVDEEFRDGCI